MKLKVCGMKYLQNIQELERQVKPDWMGLIFYPPSQRYVGEELNPELSEVSLKKVGVFVNEPLQSIIENAGYYKLSGIQLHGDESVEFAKNIKNSLGLEMFKVFKVKDVIDWSAMEPFLPWVDYFLFDTFTKSHGGSGQRFDWEVLKAYPFDKPFLLSGGVGLEQAEDIKVLKRQVSLLGGLDINSKFELKPGLKDISKIMEFKSQLI
jgi:phosphoribosylanthranilate isomerase